METPTKSGESPSPSSTEKKKLKKQAQRRRKKERDRQLQDEGCPNPIKDGNDDDEEVVEAVKPSKKGPIRPIRQSKSRFGFGKS